VSPPPKRQPVDKGKAHLAATGKPLKKEVKPERDNEFGYIAPSWSEFPIPPVTAPKDGPLLKELNKEFAVAAVIASLRTVSKSK
jgi:hypothetical protein